MATPAPDAADPVIGYTVKELITRLDGKLDAYALQQADLVSTVHGLVPLVKQVDERVGKLELINVAALVPHVSEVDKRVEALEQVNLAHNAVKAWHTTTWKIVAGIIATLASVGIAYDALHSLI